MRVLVLSHLPFSDVAGANSARAAVVALRSCGHEVRAIGVALGDSHGGPQDEGERLTGAVHLLDRSADGAPSAVPWVVAQRGATLRYADMSDETLAGHRSMLRAHVDVEIDRFNPDMIHVGEIGMMSHLALESGVTYVAAVDGREPAAADLDERLRRFIDESIENAGRLFVADGESGDQLAARYPDVADRIAVDPYVATGAAESPARGAWLAASYGDVLAQRFGRRATGGASSET